MQLNTAAVVYASAPLLPIYGNGVCQAINIPPSVTILKGTILGQLTAALNDVQTLTAGSATGGTFTLSLNDPLGNTQTTTALAFGANAAAQQAALVALTNIGAGNVVVTGTGPFVYTFGGALAGQPIPLITVNGALLTGGTAHTIAHTTVGAEAGTFKAYASGNSDGSQVPRAIMKYDAVSDAAGDIGLSPTQASGPWGETARSVPAYFGGTFDTSKLIGLDANAVTLLGRLLSGTTTAGILKMIGD